MLLLLDESPKGGRYQGAGLIALPENEIPEIESEMTRLRIRNKFWQELKWEEIRGNSNNEERYKPFIDLFFSSSACFYSHFSSQALKQYYKSSKNSSRFHKLAYCLIRATSVKIERANIGSEQKSLHVIYDQGSDESEKQIKTTREYLKTDSRNGLSVDQCCEAYSKLIGVLQLTDLLIGCAHAEINNRFSSPAKESFYNYIISKNNGYRFHESANRPFAAHGVYKLDAFKIKQDLDTASKPM